MQNRTTSLLARLALLASLALFTATSLTAAENPVSGVSLETALTDAHLLAARKPGLTVLRVEGDSMLPYFGTGAVLVVKFVSAAQLQPGMVVVYTNRFNETVAHRVVSADATGCTVQGYNNAAPDSTRVTAENLQGVVYATFHSAANATAASLAGTPLALAAPVR
jgi:signal peptidase I